MFRPLAHRFFVAVISVSIVSAGAQAAPQRFQDFNADPQWESFRSRQLPSPVPITRQDFGSRRTRRQGGRQAEIGGRIQRSLTPAWFAKVIPRRTLNDKLSASGKFAVTQDESNAGVLFGWFHETSRGWRTPNSLVFRLDGNGGKYWVFYEYGTRHWLTGGAGCFEGDRYQTTTTKPFPADGSEHTWTLSYDPEGAQGRGGITFVLDGARYTLELAPGHREDGAEFNRFGMFNQQTTGGGMEAGFYELVLEGEPIDLNRESLAGAGWEARGNRVEFQDRHLRPFHDFGWTGGAIGGVVWRDEKPAYYAATAGPLSLNDELFASGKIAFHGAGSDSGVYLGWFHSGSKTNKVISDHEAPQSNLLAVLLEGPSQVGHYFRATYRTSKGNGVIPERGPILRPDGRVHEWSIRYSPQSGRIDVQLDGEAQTLEVSPEHRRNGATFDRFGIFNLQVGGHFVDVTIDDLTYTTGPK